MTGTKHRLENRRIKLSLGALCLGLCVFFSAPSLQAQASGADDATANPAPSEHPFLGKAPPRFMLPVIHGSAEKRFGPALWTGNKAKQPKKWVLLSFFATYCAPCQKEMPELERLYKAYEDQGLGVMLVSIDKKKEEVVDIARKHEVSFPVLHDRFNVVARRYDAERLPYLLMLDEAGVVQKVHQGYSEEVKGILEAEVREGLGLPPLEKKETRVSSKAKRKRKSKQAARRQKSK